MTLSAPKLFISYSWSSMDHQAWVLDLAERLRANGVDVILDKWDLREGQDSIAFMEQMVTDPQVTHVAMISDETYAKKADGREGGVGTETTIISQRVYQSQSQSKFVLVVPSRDDSGNAYIPAYYAGRIYIDLSDEAASGGEYERLLRWVFGKPLNPKPPLGSRPAFLSEDAESSLGTEVQRHRAEEAIRNGKVYSVAATEEYFERYAAAVEKFEVAEDVDLDMQALLDAIERTVPARNELVRMFHLIAQYNAGEEMIACVRRFFESCMEPAVRQSVSQDRLDDRRDPVRFLVGELFLYFVAALLDRGRIEAVREFISPVFFARASGLDRQPLEGYWQLYGNMESERRLSQHLRKVSARAYLLNSRSKDSGVRFDALAQADVIVWLRTVGILDHYAWWLAVTPVYVSRYVPLEIFARSASSTYFSRILPLIGADSKDAFLDGAGPWRKAISEWRLGMDHVDLSSILNFPNLSTRP